ncbi:MAG: RNA polymerase-binding protein RbpA [Actinomycetaceae bacterium]|nr:RNA polymerase-binding protein RbpA [Actinomycetaceae bacterium]
MADRALRGMRMGSNSLESEEGVVFVERQGVSFTCPNGDRFEIPFALDAELPFEWECPICSAIAQRDGGLDEEEDKPLKPQRTHWDMLLERRNVDELQVLLDERLDLLRSGRLRRTF